MSADRLWNLKGLSKPECIQVSEKESLQTLRSNTGFLVTGISNHRALKKLPTGFPQFSDPQVFARLIFETAEAKWFEFMLDHKSGAEMQEHSGTVCFGTHSQTGSMLDMEMKTEIQESCGWSGTEQAQVQVVNVDVNSLQFGKAANTYSNL